jgi:hypothetical protein
MTRKASAPASTLTLFLSVLTTLIMLAGTAVAQNPVIDPTNRTVTTSSFVVEWSTSNDTEAITSISWSGGPNLTSDQGLGTCFPSFPGSIEYFGNSYAPPDPWAGGLVLVGGGTTTPPGTTAWSGQILPSGTAQVTINSSSTGCPPSSAGINVQTTYSFFNPGDPGTNWFGVQRDFDFTATTFAHDFRPYMPRLSLGEGFTEVLYPDTSGALASLSVYDCGSGCTGPIAAPNAASLNPPWDATQGWFAIHNPNTLQGVVVKRNPSTDPQGNAIVAQLWIDNDAGSNTNVSSFLLMSPTEGFTGGPVTEVETLCFYNSSIWTPSLTPPAGCSNVGSSPTNTTLTSSLNPSVYGQTVIFTAAVTASSGTPTGSVVFTDTSTSTPVGSATLVSGTASISVSSLVAGAHSIAATYEGSATFASSTSSPSVQTVGAANTSTVLASTPNPAGSGQIVTLTATVASQYGGATTGTVTFFSGSQTLGTASLSGSQATLGTSFSAAGTYPITTHYNGDNNNLGSTSATLSQKIIASTTTALTSSPNPALIGQTIAFAATVTSSSGTPPNGEIVTFYNGSASLGTVALTGGVASFASSLPAGVYSITASYAGDANFAASTSPVLQQVVNSTTKSATATTLMSSLNPSIYGQKVTWSATVTTSGAVPPKGKVKFTWGIYTLGTVSLNGSGVATLSKSNLNADTYPLTAIYLGDANNLGSTSTILNQVVQQTTSSATLTSSPNPSTPGEAVVFTAEIKSPTVKAGGIVTFTAGFDTALGTAVLNNGKATFTTSALPAGTTEVTLFYLGDSNIKSSATAVDQVVQPVAAAAPR